MKLLIIDDDPLVISSLKRLFMAQSWLTDTFTSATEALQQVEKLAADVVICDLKMPQIGGIEFLKEYKLHHPQAVRIVLSGHTDTQGLLKAINEAEIYRFISKPWNNDEMIITLQNAYAHQQAVLEKDRLIEQLKHKNSTIDQQAQALRKLEKECEGITKVQWDADGSILVDPDQYR